MITKIKYGNTNTFYVSGTNGGILVDTDWAGTLPAFYKAIKDKIKSEQIKYLLITHYHPDHMGIAGELMGLGIKLLLVDIQKDYIHFADPIFAKEKNGRYTPISADQAVIITCDESRDILKRIGISGEIIYTPGHSDDSVSLVLDNGSAIVGDLYTWESALGYENPQVMDSWQLLKSKGVTRAYYGHANEQVIEGGDPL